MIYEALNFLRLKLDAYITDGRVGTEPVLVLANPWTNNDSNKNFSFLNSLSLINIEEERVFKTQVPKVIPQDKTNYIQRAPDLKLNLYVMISAYNKNYEDALKLISKVVGYFQVSNVFEKDRQHANDTELLPEGIEKLIVELYTASFEQQNQIWASLSTGYLPSVIYKVRMLVVDIDLAANKHTYPSIQEINVAVKNEEYVNR